MNKALGWGLAIIAALILVSAAMGGFNHPSPACSTGSDGITTCTEVTYSTP